MWALGRHAVVGTDEHALTVCINRQGNVCSRQECCGWKAPCQLVMWVFYFMSCCFKNIFILLCFLIDRLIFLKCNWLTSSVPLVFSYITCHMWRPSLSCTVTIFTLFQLATWLPSYFTVSTNDLYLHSSGLYCWSTKTWKTFHPLLMFHQLRRGPNVPRVNNEGARTGAVIWEGKGDM